ncbi:MAG: type II secretion system F family protein [Elusimicrobiota bacterium]
MNFNMPDYLYKARDKYGKTVSGVMAAENPAALSLQLKEMGYYVGEIREQTEKKKAGFPTIPSLSKKVNKTDIMFFAQQLATMINAGLPMLRSFNILVKETRKQAFKKVIADIQKNIESGISLSDCLKKHSAVFPAFFVSLVRAGEASGALDETLRRLVEYMEYEQEIKSKLRSALIYPVILVVVAISVVIFLLTFIIPKFVDTFLGLGIELPLPTKITLGLSSFMKANSLYLAVGIVFLAVVFFIYTRTKTGRYLYDKFKLNIPVIGILVRKIILSRFSQTLSLLLRSGLPILQSLEIVKTSIANKVLAGVISNVYTNVRDGGTIAAPLEASNEFTPLVINMISLGEETGTVDQMLSKVAVYYQQQVDIAIKDLISMVEPVILVGIGLIVGFIALSLFMPLFQMSGKIG